MAMQHCAMHQLEKPTALRLRAEAQCWGGLRAWRPWLAVAWSSTMRSWGETVCAILAVYVKVLTQGSSATFTRPASC
eukprot:5594497-Amphidinium_carterae.2